MGRRTARTAVPQRPVPRTVRWGLPALIVVLVLLCFQPVLRNDFVNWDDPFYFVNNTKYRGLSLAHLRWMFTTVHMSHYQPLSWLTHGVVYSLSGVDPRAYHFANLLLHAANGVLLYVLIAALLEQAWSADARVDHLRVRVAAAVGALFFALHPLRVEAVAWATERQEVLCALFFLFSVLSYVQMHTAQGGRRQRWYLLSVGCFALSLLSKAAGIMLPVVLLILDAYPLRRLAGEHGERRWAVLAEKIPYLTLVLAAAAVVYFAKRAHDVVTLAEHGVRARAMQVAYGLSFYLWKTVVPLRLSPLYPLPHPLDPTQPVYLLCALVVAGITSGLVVVRRRYPWALTAWLSYVVIVFPVLGIVQAGPQIAADRYTYLSCLTWSVLVGAGIYRLRGFWQPHGARWPVQPSAIAALTVAFAVLGVGTYEQSGVWHDSITLWTHVLKVEPSSDFAYHNRGQARHLKGDVAGALADYDQAIRLEPMGAKLYSNRGIARQAKGDVAGALADFDAAIRLMPTYANAYSGRASARYTRADVDGALADLNAAIRLNPDYAEAYYNRGNVRHLQGDLADALADYDEALRLQPQYTHAYDKRGLVRRTLGDLPGAVADFSTALQLTPAGAARTALESNLTATRRQLDRRQ